ncbi:alpha-tocopherol transfer protein-like [Thrips palmi]|uniref:Alpha-tocopherol transfer protein-like n=1 Tax=Thrips palmi TaxID=161013 RepID=A0A6P8YRP7_THRPL|nr:alpha-tocopherol transfer protein-like [Thrips palmi]
MDLQDPKMKAVVANFFDLEKAIEKDPDLSHEKLDVLRSWSKNRDDIFPGMTDMQLLLFLQSCYGDTEAAKECMTMYFNCILEVPQFFDHWDVTRDQIKQGLDTVYYSPMPRLSPKNHLMMVCRFRHTDASKYVFSDGSRIFMMTTEAQFLSRGPQEGLCAIMDMTNMCFSHLWRFPVPLVRRFIGMIQEGMPVRLKEIHIVNCSYFLPTLMSFLKPFMKKELADLIQCHSGAMDSFREQFPAEYLPTELGGTAGSLQQHHDDNVRLLGKLTPLWEAKDAWSSTRRQSREQDSD